MKKIMLLTGVVMLLLVNSSSAQSQSAIEFYDSTGSEDPASKIGWAGTAEDGHFFIETPDDGDGLTIKNGNVKTSGSFSAAKFIGDGSQLTGINSDNGMDSLADGAVTSKKIADGSIQSKHIAAGAVKDESIDSVSWDKIKGMPEGFADGVDNIGESGSMPDSVRAASIADSTKKIPNNSVTSGKIAGNAVIEDKIADDAVTNEKIFSVHWDKITSKPSSYPTSSDDVDWSAGTSGQVWKMSADGTPEWSADLQGAGGATTINGIEGLSDSLSAHRTLINSKADATDLAAKADADDVYTKTEVTSLLSSKASTSDVSGKANASDVYTQTQVDGLLDDKADATDVYTKTEVTSLLSSKANSSDLAGKADASDVYTQNEVDVKVAEVADAVDYSRRSTAGYETVDGANTTVLSMTVSCPSAGILIVTGTCTVYGNSDATTDLMGVQGAVTVDNTTMPNLNSFITFPSNGGHSYPLSHTYGFQITSAGEHTVRFIISPTESSITSGTYRIYHPHMTCFFSKERM